MPQHYRLHGKQGKENKHIFHLIQSAAEFNNEYVKFDKTFSSKIFICTIRIHMNIHRTNDPVDIVKMSIQNLLPIGKNA
jgi:hypothetical protein